MRLFKISDKKYLRYMNNTTALSVHHLKKTFRRVCQNSFSAKDSYHFVKNNRYQRVNNSMITVTLIFMRE